MVTYNKIYKKKDGRVLVASGPRSVQARQGKNAEPSVKSSEIDSLREDIKKLTNNIPTNAGAYSREKVDEMINAAIEEVSIELEEKYISEIKYLKNKNIELKSTVEKLDEKLDKKDDMILSMTVNAKAAGVGEVIVDDDRPAIDSIFIDPTKKDEENKFESHIVNKDPESGRSKVKSNVDKLRKLIKK